MDGNTADSGQEIVSGAATHQRGYTDRVWVVSGVGSMQSVR